MFNIEITAGNKATDLLKFNFIAELFTPNLKINLSSLYLYFVIVSHTPFIIKHCFIFNSTKILLTIKCKIKQLNITDWL